MDSQSSVIKIKPFVKKRLDVMKKGNTYSDIIENMVNYFETTGVEPKAGQIPPVLSFTKTLQEGNQVLYKRIEDLIKIIRNIETNKLDIMLQALVSHTPAVLKEDEELISEHDLAQIIEVNEGLNKQIEEKNNLIKSLTSELSELKQNNLSQEIVNTVKELLSDKILTKSGESGFYLAKNHRDQLFRKLDTIIHVQ